MQFLIELKINERPSTIISYEERFQRLAKIINIVIEVFTYPLLSKSTQKSAKNINSSLNNLNEGNFQTENVNHQDLNTSDAYIFFFQRNISL